MTTVLFLGLGHMGGPMAANLAAAGHRVLGFDLVPEALEKARAAGVETVTDTAAAAAAADVVLTMLCLLYTSPSPRDATLSRMPSSA